MRLKPGVRLHPDMAMAFAMLTVNETFKDFGNKGAVITSGTEGEHKSGSLHYNGKALDFRIWGLKNNKQLLELVGALKERLGRDFDVILEEDHIHVEYQPE